MSKHPGVAILQKAKGGTFTLKFRDPRRPSKDNQRKASAETKDYDAATRIACDLSRIIHNKEYWDNPPDVHPRALAIWDVVPLAKRVDEAIEGLSDGRRFPNRGTQMISGAIDLLHGGEKESVVQYKQEVEDLLGRLKNVTEERDAERLRRIKLEGIVRKMGNRALRDYAPVPVKEAVEDFMKSGTGANGQFKKTIRAWVDRFVKEVGEDTNIFDVREEQVSNHLAPFKSQANFKSVSRYVRKFMKHATKGTFANAEVLAWQKSLRLDDEPPKRWFWLDREQVFKLVDELRKLYGDYWADAALLQYGLGLRPEELPLLRLDNVRRDGKKAFIRLESIYDGKKRLRRLKTRRSHSEEGIDVPSWALEALKRREAVGGYLLFPWNGEACRKWTRATRQEKEAAWKAAMAKTAEKLGIKTGKKPPQLVVLSEFELQNELWPPADAKVFSNAYRPRLRKAAEGAKLPREKIDSRTLRRTCAREMILAQGFEAAAVLRDSIETLRAHYADLLPSDVTTER